MSAALLFGRFSYLFMEKVDKNRKKTPKLLLCKKNYISLQHDHLSKTY